MLPESGHAYHPHAHAARAGDSAIFLELTYHLEHHLFPQVPSHRLPEPARRLDPYFDRAGVRPRRVL